MCPLSKLDKVDVLTPLGSKVQSLRSTKEPEATAVLSFRMLRVWKCTCSFRAVCVTQRGEAVAEASTQQGKMTPIILAATATTEVRALSGRWRTPSAKEIVLDVEGKM